MIEGLLAIIDRLIQLSDYRDRRVRVLFDEVLTPIFHDLSEIHAAYGKLLKETRRLLPGEKLPYGPLRENEPGSFGVGEDFIDVGKAIEYLREERQGFEPVRIRLVQMLLAVDYSNLKSPAARDFLDSVIEYFPRGCGLAEISRLARAKRQFLPDSTAGLLASDDNWSKTLLSYLEAYRRELESSKTVPETDQAEVIDLVEFFVRRGYSAICRRYADLKIEIVKRNV